MIGSIEIPKKQPWADALEWFRDRGVPVIRLDVTGMADDEVARMLEAELSSLQAEAPAPKSIKDILDGLEKPAPRRADLEAEITELNRQIKGYQFHLDACQQIAGKTLGYPWFKDDQKNFPGATDAAGVCIGEHAGETIVEELANAYQRLQQTLWDHPSVTDFAKAILHGDDVHQAWLLEAANDFAAGKPVEPARSAAPAPMSDEELRRQIYNLTEEMFRRYADVSAKEVQLEAVRQGRLRRKK